MSEETYYVTVPRGRTRSPKAHKRSCRHVSGEVKSLTAAQIPASTPDCRVCGGAGGHRRTPAAATRTDTEPARNTGTIPVIDYLNSGQFLQHSKH